LVGSAVSLDRPERTSLYLRLPTLVLWSNLPVTLLFLGLAVRGTYVGRIRFPPIHDPFIWFLFAGSLAFGLVNLLFVVTGRIDLDGQGISFIPLNPLRRAQSFGWSDIGDFQEKRVWDSLSERRRAVLQAPIRGDQPFRGMFGLSQSFTLTVSTTFAPSRLGRPMGASGLRSLLDSYRS
jgi:hypothetical protein